MRKPTRRRASIVSLLTMMTMACSSGGESPANPRGDASPLSPATPTPGSAPSAPAGASGFVEGRDYTVLQRARFMDAAGFEQPAEAFSVLLPRGWTHEGGVVWKDLQACRGEMVGARWSASSPDGAIRYEARPVHAWGSSSDPMMQQQLQMLQRQGGCDVGGVVDAAQYLREVFVPRELPGASVTEIRENAPGTRELRAQADAGMARLAQYAGGARIEVAANAAIARLAWPDGGEGIALVSVQNIITTMPNAFTGIPQRLTNSSASERSVLRFPAARRKEAETVLANLKASVRTNPQWKAAIDGYFARMRQQADAMHHQRMQAIAIQTAANARTHAQRMADIQRQGAANTRRFEQRMADMDSSMRAWETQQSSQDRLHTAFVQTIREVETWQGGDGRVELSSGYEHAWSRGDGSYILSNSPSFDPRSVFLDQHWEALKRADP
jgi:hypothetical protein